MEFFKRIKRELAYKGKLIDFYKDTILIRNETRMEYDFIGHKGAAAMIPIDKDGNIVMVRQHRNAIDDFSLEIPAGGLDKGEDMLDCAVRECEEESGYKANNAKHLIDIYTSVAFSNEQISIYYTEDLVKTKQDLDENEYVNVETYSLEELISMIYKGEIMDSKTIAGLLAYKNLKDK